MSGGGTSTTKQELSPEQQQLLGLVIPAATDISNNTPQLAPGPAVAPFTPLQQAGQASAVDTATNQINPLVNSTVQANMGIQQNAIPAGAAGLEGLIAGTQKAAPAQDFILSGAALRPDSNPALQQSADAAVNTLSTALMEQVLPGIRRGAQTAGQVGSSRQGIAEGLAIRDFQQQSGQITSDIFSKGYGQGLDALTKTLGTTLGTAGDSAKSLFGQGVNSLFAAPELSKLSLLPSQVLSAVGGQQQQQNQNVMTSDANRFMQEQMMPFLVAQDVANLAFGLNNGTTTSTNSGDSASAMAGILPLLLMLG